MQLGLNINTGTQIISRPSDLAEWLGCAEEIMNAAITVAELS